MTKSGIRWNLRIRNKVTDEIVTDEFYTDPEIPRAVEVDFEDSKWFTVTVTAISAN